MPGRERGKPVQYGNLKNALIRCALFAVAPEDRTAADELPAVLMMRRSASRADHFGLILDRLAADLAERGTGVRRGGGTGLDDRDSFREFRRDAHDQSIVKENRLADRRGERFEMKREVTIDP